MGPAFSTLSDEYTGYSFIISSLTYNEAVPIISPSATGRLICFGMLSVRRALSPLHKRTLHSASNFILTDFLLPGDIPCSLVTITGLSLMASEASFDEYVPEKEVCNS